MVAPFCTSTRNRLALVDTTARLVSVIELECENTMWLLKMMLETWRQTELTGKVVVLLSTTVSVTGSPWNTVCERGCRRTDGLTRTVNWAGALTTEPLASVMRTV